VEENSTDVFSDAMENEDEYSGGDKDDEESVLLGFYDCATDDEEEDKWSTVIQRYQHQILNPVQSQSSDDTVTQVMDKAHFMDMMGTNIPAWQCYRCTGINTGMTFPHCSVCRPEESAKIRAFPTRSLPSQYGLGIFSIKLEISGFIHGQVVKVRYAPDNDNFTISFRQEAVIFQTSVDRIDLKRYSDEQKLIIDPYRVSGCDSQIKTCGGNKKHLTKLMRRTLNYWLKILLRNQ
jgi:hypothetical protein